MSNIDNCLWSKHLVVTRAVTAYCARDWRWEQEPDLRTGYNLWLIRKGQGKIVSGGHTYSLNPGDCFLLRMWESQVGTHDSENPLTVPFVLFDCFDEQGKDCCHELEVPRHYRVRNLDFFCELVDRIISAHRQENAAEAEHWLQAALLELRQWQPSEELSPLQQEQVAKIERVCRLIQREVGRRFPIDQLAAECHYSKDHFIRIFKKVKGMPPGEFVIRSRLQEADALLLFSNHSVARIAELLGYPDEFTFSHQFKAWRGLSPANYRKGLLS